MDWRPASGRMSFSGGLGTCRKVLGPFPPNRHASVEPACTPGDKRRSLFKDTMSSEDGRSGISTIAGYASQEFRNADKLDARRAFDRLDGLRKPLEAERARADAERLMKPPHNLVGNASTEIVPAIEPGAHPPMARLCFVSTLEDPNTISVDAAEYRAAVATRAGVLSPALDAAVTIGARNSVEKMIAHQIAASHMAGMEILVRIQEQVRLPPVELARLTNAAARLFEVCQTGAATILKLKLKGRQRVVVQHQQVNVGNGGRAVVAGRLEGALPGGRDRQNEE